MYSDGQRKKILAVSSRGGHWNELQRLILAFEEHNVVFIVAGSGGGSEAWPFPCRIVRDANCQQIIPSLLQGLEVLAIVLRERPDVVISTGASCGFFALLFGKLCGARTIWVDSLANVKKLSLSGRMVRRFADLWLTQWPERARPGGPYFKGSLL